MGDAIFMRVGADEQLTRLGERPYDAEALLQGLVAAHPDLLPGDQIDIHSPRRWLLLAEEARIQGDSGEGDSWVDLLFVDQDAVLTFVEAKLSRNPEMRRKVTGQLLEYAALASIRWSAEGIKGMFDDHCSARSSASDATLVLTEFLGEGGDPEGFWDQVVLNLREGRLRIVFLADEIPRQLRAVVEFLNLRASPMEVLAVEIRQYSGDDDTPAVFVPTLYGQTVESQESKPRTKRKWDEASFLAVMRRQQPEGVVRVAEELLAWTRSRMSGVWWGEGRQLGSFYPTLDFAGQHHILFAAWTSGIVEMQFQYMNRPPIDESVRQTLRSMLNEIPEIDLEDRPRPSFRMAALVDEDALKAFLTACDWYVDLITVGRRSEV